MADSFSPPQEARANARRGLELRAKYGRGGTEIGVARARDLSNGKSLSLDTVNRMVSYFARHEVDKKGEGWGVDSAGYIAWLLWGGDAGRSWANRISREQKAKEKMADKPNYEDINSGGAGFEPSDSDLYNRIKREAQDKFDVYPSAVANAWVVREYKDRGGKYRKEKEKSMNLDLAYSYAGIIKQEKQADGTLKVYGKATDDAIDIDQQICDEAWLKDAMPDWFTSGGNIREQHSNIAAGVATDYESKSDGHYITALIVDPVSVKKVETGVLKGFSIGIRGPRVIRDEKAAGGRIVGGQIVEVSVVDRPANPNAKMVIAKAVDGELQAVKQINIPNPAEAFSTIQAGIVKEAHEGVPLSEETTVTETDDVTEVIEETVDAVDVAPEVELIDAAKSLLATLNKFDQATYDRARVALAELIVVEANEMAETGISEKDSIEELLDSVKHLFRWYEGEVAEGEVEGVENLLESGVIELAADPTEDITGEDEKLCATCGKTMKLCKCATMAADDEMADDSEKSATLSLDVDADTVDAIVAKAVTTAREAVSAEIAVLKSAQEAALSKATQLETELATALSKAAGGGPKRSLLNAENTAAADEFTQKAAQYLLKAQRTDDKTLSEGYRDIAEDFKLKAAKAARKDAN